MKQKVLAGILLTALSAGLVACGSTGSESTSNTVQETAAGTTESAQASTVSESESAAETEAAESSDASATEELSGTVTVYMPSPTDLNTAYIEGFEAKTGVKVELFEGTTGEIQARLEAEKDNPVADVVVLASWSDGLAMKESGQIMSYPEAENADKLYDGWVDEDHMLFGTSASALGVIYNTTLIDNLDADWSELADPQYKDMIAIPDPEKSGSCKDFLAGYMCSTNNDWSAWEGMAENGLMVAGANKAALETVTTGERAILVAGVDYNAYSNIDKGEPLAIYYPESGTVINPRPAMIMKTSKNVENAKAFIDYLMSDEAQQMVADAYLLPGRSDITCDNRTNVSDIPTFDNLDWNTMMENSSDIAAKLNELCQ
ncbi:iron(III) transport system substrate-binding protein [Catenibacillus scindens]|uniref:Iron(III) transport system substrate-binding protein n=1 Tax=Catenibacillus scindens TaxID=673271 RepID=A0A7W8HDA9_9FIRM|nr:ABC transporter substrate-binding protein [Catenibacillus scindens]MBB5266386.1 iron(III) transport system substrate-binding protein [Catenibacillus scindens]